MAALALGITLIIVFCAVSMNSGGSSRGRRGMSGMSGLGGRDLTLGGRLDGLAAHRRHGLVMVSRMMPGPAGRRWLAETESVLWEITAARRGAAVRSYLLSGPRVAAVMWARASREINGRGGEAASTRSAGHTLRYGASAADMARLLVAVAVAWAASASGW